MAYSLASTPPEPAGSGDGYTAESLGSMTVAQLKALAAGEGYTLTKTKKADIIDEILEQQEGNA